jgi:CHAT domain-containing protein
VPVMGRHRADALIVTATGIRHVPLPDLTMDRLRQHAGHMVAVTGGPATPGTGEESLFAALAWLWDAVAEPVLDTLGLIRRPAPTPLPRVWWCPTGQLSHLPFHAAGRHRNAVSVLDLTVPSYTSTVRALRGAVPFRPRPDSRTLLVGLPYTPGLPDLPGAEEEVALLAGRLPGSRLLRGPAATRTAVATALSQCDIAHFACHGGEDADRQYERHLCLYDGRLELDEITKAQAGHSGLAYLSACGTARRRLSLPDESFSLASAFQLAGFSEVVASLWPIADRTALQIVRSFYTALLTEPPAPAAHALHTATLAIRNRHPDRPSLWAPYIHMGP